MSEMNEHVLDLDSFGVLMDDVRSEVVEASKVIKAAMEAEPHAKVMGALATIERLIDTPRQVEDSHKLDDLLALLTTRLPASGSRRRWLLPGAGVALGLLCLGGGFWLGRCPSETVVQAQQAAFANKLDDVLVKHWGALPLSTQQALHSTYSEANFSSPGGRKGRR